MFVSAGSAALSAEPRDGPVLRTGQKATRKNSLILDIEYINGEQVYMYTLYIYIYIYVYIIFIIYIYIYVIYVVYVQILHDNSRRASILKILDRLCMTTGRSTLAAGLKYSPSLVTVTGRAEADHEFVQNSINYMEND